MTAALDTLLVEKARTSGLRLWPGTNNDRLCWLSEVSSLYLDELWLALVGYRVHRELERAKGELYLRHVRCDSCTISLGDAWSHKNPFKSPQCHICRRAICFSATIFESTNREEGLLLTHGVGDREMRFSFWSDGAMQSGQWSRTFEFPIFSVLQAEGEGKMFQPFAKMAFCFGEICSALFKQSVELKQEK